ncbi:hypothetical protein EDB19DRAFT_1062784 [Suillus lakei]|nr:hypothetical protein EDB19DRAFT_1062784 [Suillus lakei]
MSLSISSPLQAVSQPPATHSGSHSYSTATSACRCSHSTKLILNTKHKTGELLRNLNKGSTVNRVSKLIGFTMILVLVDVGVALVVFVVGFGLVLGVLFVQIRLARELLTWSSKLGWTER